MKFRTQEQQGIALVITLIMLSVTLIMAVAFLAISTRERGSVSTSTDATHSREATEAALAAAESQIIASMLATTNSYNFGMFVSTNYINPNAFISGSSSPTNVNYFYTNGFPLDAVDYQQNIANLWYLPRAPVFVTNSSLGGYDFRFYLDLNRNGVFDGNNGVSNLVYLSSGVFINAGPLTNVVGDPEWIGVLEHPDQPHGPLNHFIGRYAFIAVPVGNTLDVNAIYNDATMPDYSVSSPGTRDMNPGEDGFLRNEGVGSWELNLAAFLADLNTNEWDNNTFGNGYDYRTALPGALINGSLASSAYVNNGSAFEDALAILRYRYAYGLTNQLSVDQLYSNTNNYQSNNIDNYTVGSLMTNNLLPVPSDFNFNFYIKPWSGAVNTNQFFSLSDFFNPAIFRPQGYTIAATTPVFPDRLLNAGTNWHIAPLAGGGPAITNVSTYDRYTFYRMLSQLGTDSTPDYGKLNLNYVNVNSSGTVVPGMETNFIPWNPSQFFTNAADRLLKTYSTNWYAANFTFFTNIFGTNIVPFGIANIPVWVGSQFVYTPAVNRLLQLAANLYDATTTNPYPSVFRPTFFRDPQTGNIFVNGYQYITNVFDLTDSRLATPVDVSALVAGNIPLTGSGFTLGLNNVNVYGIPWIIGAKKGLPSFNELYMLNNVQVTRKLQVNRPGVINSDYTTNQQFIMSITNTVGMSFWNSYYSNYVGSGNLTVFMSDTMRMGLTNGAFPPTNYNVLIFTNIYNLSYWPGSLWNSSAAPPSVASVSPASFVSYVFTNAFLPTSAYRSVYGDFVNLTNNPPWETNVVSNYPFPQFGLLTTNWAQAFVLDGPQGFEHIVDYVQFSGPSTNRNLDAEIADPNYPDNSGIHYMWSTNAYVRNTTTPPTYGEANQIMLSRGIANVTAPPGGTWTQITSQGADGTPAAQQAFFNALWNATGIYQYPSDSTGLTYSNTELTVQAPFTPTRSAYDFTLWQANDPLVHYMASDLNYSSPGQIGLQHSDLVPPVFNLPNSALNLSQVGGRYQPWGLAAQMAGIAGVDTNQYNLSYKDPLVWGSDYWDFPTNLYPTVGWLGRVHRGTPWQTVYLKSTDILPLAISLAAKATTYIGTNTWQYWSGNVGNYYDAVNAAPVNDRLLFDIFTTGPNENATRGELSVNQPQFAAWSALLSGMTVYTNLYGTNAIIQPGGVQGTNSPLGYIWNSIQQTRSNTNLFYAQVFNHMGQVLAAPGLTVNSPFLPWNDPLQTQLPNQISDAMYEWLPQQMMSLVKLGAPRYVIYCYGQALKPAPNGLVTSGPNALMCTNYQIVSESAVRAVIQVENPASATPNIILKNVNPLPPDQ